jgi:cell division protein FtsL
VARAKRARRLLALAILATGIGLLVVVSAHVSLAQNQMQLERLRADVEAEQENYEQLRLDVAQLESPERITAEATGRLGMRRPDEVTYLVPVTVTPNPAQAQLPPQASVDEGLGTFDESLDDYQAIKPDLAEQR